MPPSRFVSVAVPVPVLAPLTYAVPDGVPVPPRGARVLVPLGARQLTGCVVSGADDHVPAPAGDTVRWLIDVVDDAPFLPDAVVDLAAWVAEYYMCSLGEALATAAPPFAWSESRAAVRLTAHRTGGLAGIRADVIAALEPGRVYPRSSLERLLLKRLEPAAGAGRSRDALRQAIVKELRAMERDGVLEHVVHLAGPAATTRTVRTVRSTAAGLDPAIDDGLPARQREAMVALRGLPDGLDVPAAVARGFSRAVLDALVRRGLARIANRTVERDPFDEEAAAALAERERMKASVVATPEQDAALDTLGALAEGGFSVALLHGVTGSGKTEVYRRLALRVRDSGRAVLILVPEIALTPAVAATFRFTFGERVAIQHSALSAGERHDQWHRIRRGDVDVVVGTRSAVFAPLARLGLVIVDEEHDTSYKQEDSPRYNGRDVAIVRARSAGALALLGSATPALETAQNADSGRYHRVVLTRRVADRPLADVRIVDMREEYANEGPDVVLSGALRDALTDCLSRGEQAIVLLNRRGYASAVFCRKCGATFDCPNCSVSLTVHRASRRAQCHYCDYTITVPSKCTACGGEFLDYVGIGTERVEAEIEGRFPGVRLARVDRDTVRRKGEIARVLRRFGDRELDVLVGTQMLAKGHDFPAVTLVGVVSADVGLGLADFRAAERTFQLLTQVAGRAGRGDVPGLAVVQTLFPQHYSIRHAKTQDYAAFFAEELRYRQAMRYPPAVALVNVVVRGRTAAEAMVDAGVLATGVRRRHPPSVDVLGPAPAPLSKLRGEHRAQFFLKGANRRVMREALAAALAEKPSLHRRVTVDVDPLSVL